MGQNVLVLLIVSLNEKRLGPLACNEKKRFFELSIRDTRDHWRAGFKDRKFCSVDGGQNFATY